MAPADSATIANMSYQEWLKSVAQTIKETPDAAAIVIIDPPWGLAFNATQGLDLRHTSPPVRSVIECVKALLRMDHIIFIIKTHELLLSAGLYAVTTGHKLHARGTTSKSRKR